jgi:chitodextrinase
VATVGALDQVAVAKGNSTTVDSGPTGSISAGELVVGGILTGGPPGSVTAGSSQGQNFIMLTQSSGDSANLEDILSSTAGTQDARATFGTATDWYAVVATFHTSGSGNTSPPSVPTGLIDTLDTASSVGLSWNASTDSTGTLAGYTVYRNGTSIGTANASMTTFTDSTVQPSTTYSHTVDAFDTAGNHSAQPWAIQVTTPAAPPPSAHWVQGGAVSTGSQVASMTITLTSPVSAGDLLVGWFGQYNSSGQVQVSDNRDRRVGRDRHGGILSGPGLHHASQAGSADLEHILVSVAGAQDARATFSSATDWYAVAAVFHQA